MSAAVDGSGTTWVRLVSSKATPEVFESLKHRTSQCKVLIAP